jgi:hypothetical protein
MKRGTLAVMVTGFLASCGTAPGVNSDVPNGISLGLSPPSVENPADDVKVFDSGFPPSKPGQKVSGTSCKNKVWDPPPSEENAVALLKRQAAQRGYNAIHSVQIVYDKDAISKNCWAAISATAIAFHFTN